MTLKRIQASFPVWDYYYSPHLPLDRNAKILDLGCGNGAFVYYLQQRGYNQVTGVDVSVQQIEEGKTLGIQSILLGDAKEFLSNNMSQFDCIIARDVIEHFTRQEAFDLISMICDSLRSGGKFIMQVRRGIQAEFLHPT